MGAASMIRRIIVKRYKSLRDVEVKLEPLSVLFGPNAAGKSNFIDAIQLLSRIASSRSLKEAFDPPYRGKPLESFSFGDSGLAGLMDKESVSFEIEAAIEISPHVIETVEKEILETKRGLADANGVRRAKPHSFIHHKLLLYRIQIEISPRSGILRVVDEHLVALGKDGRPRSRPQAFIEKVKDRIHLRMEGQSHPRYFDSGLDHSIVSQPHYPPHYPHLTAFKKELQSWQFYYFEPRERMRAPTAVKEVRHIGLMGEELAAYLNTLRNLDLRQFRAVEKALHSLIPSITAIQTEVNKIGEVELSLLEGSVAMPARVLSEGTLRALGLLALSGAKEPPAVIGFEEPENGVHPRRIREIARILCNRAETGMSQLIVTTHSPILPDHVPDRCLFVCQKGLDGTTIRPFSAWGPIARRSEIDSALDEPDDTLPISQRLLRGDFDA